MITIDRAKNGYAVREHDMFNSPHMEQPMPTVFETFENMVKWLEENIEAWQDGDDKKKATTSV